MKAKNDDLPRNAHRQQKAGATIEAAPALQPLISPETYGSGAGEADSERR
jgi:hypothetical protein